MLSEEILVLLFLVVLTIFQVYGHAKHILLLQVVCIAMLMFGGIWAATELHYVLVLLFLVVNVVFFTLGAFRK